MIASPTRSAIDNTLIWAHACACGRNGMVSVTTMLFPGTFHGKRFGRLHEGAGGVHHVVQDHGHLVPHVADDGHGLGLVRRGTPLVDDGQVRIQPFGESPGPLGPARIGRNDGQVAVKLAADVLDQHRRGEQVVHRYVKKALDLARVQVHGDNPVGAGHGQHVRHQLGADRHPGRHLLVLPRVTVVRYDGRDPAGRRALERIDHQQEFDQVVVDR